MKGNLIFIFLSLFIFTMTHIGESAEIKFVVGSVNLSRKGKTTDVYPGFKLMVGDSLKTGKKSLAIISISSGSIIKIRENTLVNLSEISNKGNKVRLNLSRGSVFSKVLKGKNRDFSIRARTIVASVRGTQFFFAYGRETGGKSDLWLCVNEGGVSVRDIKKKSDGVLVKEGEGIIITGGSKIGAPKEYGWTENLNWNMNPEKGDVVDRTDLNSAYTDLLDQDYD